jgi:hypothetical protein
MNIFQQEERDIAQQDHLRRVIERHKDNLYGIAATTPAVPDGPPPQWLRDLAERNEKYRLASADNVAEAASELRVALSQAIPSDDQIIVGHMKTAHDLLVAPRKPAQSITQPTPLPPPTGTEQFIRSVEQECPECLGSGRDSASVDLLAFDAPDCPECAGSGRAIVTRNYLAEALAIAANPDSTRVVEREHLVAIIIWARQFVSASLMLPDVKLPEVAA